MKKLIYLLVIISVISCNSNNEKSNETKNNMKIEYPKTKKVDVVDDYFGTKVPDPYRWLENDTSAETKEWVKAENKVTFDYLSKIPFRDKIKNRLKQIINYPKVSTPFKSGDLYFYYKNTGLQDQSVLYVTKDYNVDGEVILDPNKLSDDGTVALSTMGVSNDGKYLAYAISKAGSDWQEIFVKNIETKEMLKDHLNWVKFSGIAWYKDGFYYSGYDAPVDGKEYSNKNEFHKLYYHKLGTPQSDDKIIMQNKDLPLRMFYASVTDDEKYLLVYEENVGSRGNKIHLKDLENNFDYVELTPNFDYEYSFIGNDGSVLYFVTNDNAPKYKLVKFDLSTMKNLKPQDVIPEGDNVLESVSFVNNKLVAIYMKDAHNVIDIFDTNGKKINSVDLPTMCTVDNFTGKKDDKIGFYNATSFLFPSTVYKYDFETNKSEVFFKPQVDFADSLYETKQIFYKSKDGTKIPMFITCKKGLKLDGSHPTLLYAYGGFNISLTPSFSSTRLIWLENNGVFAVANLRGGGEYGQKWHEGGMKLNKQNVFDDFISAAEYLISEKYTSNKLLTIQGGSNGGLLIGAVTNQRPDLFAVALPAVGVMDMLRYQKFTIGWNWITDYGSSDDSIQFNNLIKFSPLHNIKENVDYPPVLVTTADHDDRVVPAHSFKYIATLQEKYKGKNPVLIRIETKAGHGGGKPVSKIIDEYADLWSFAFYNMGISPKY